jgi:hypothetical protein
MLKQWNAMSFRSVLDNGRTKPLVIECIRIPDSIVLDLDSPAPERREFVVKAIGNPEVDESLIVKELLGNILARSYGLATPEPGLIRISDTFAKTVNPALLSKYGFQILPGIAAGCEFIRGGFTPPTSNVFFTQAEMASLAVLYGFDLVTQNPDRLPNRPNFGLIGRELVAFDFDHCFSFLYPLFIFLGHPWEVSKHGIAQKHFCYPALKNAREPIIWADNINAVMSFSDELLGELTAWIPETWSGNSAKVREHIAEIREHLGAFELELQGSVQ